MLPRCQKGKRRPCACCGGVESVVAQTRRVVLPTRLLLLSLKLVLLFVLNLFRHASGKADARSFQCPSSSSSGAAIAIATACGCCCKCQCYFCSWCS